MSVLKLLSFYCSDEFEKCKDKIAQQVGISNENIAIMIAQNNYYDVEKYHEEWSKKN